MKNLFVAICFFVAFSVSSQYKSDISLLTDNEWINKDLDYIRFHNDTVVYNISNNKQELLFDVEKRKLHIKTSYRVAGEIKYETFEFNIKQLQKDKLVIEPAEKEKDKIAEYRKLEVNPLVKEKQYVFYNRGQLVSRVNFKKITFHSSTCFGLCPSVSVEVNNDGTVFYNGRTYAGLEGNYEGKMDANTLLELKKMLNRSQLYVLDQKWKQLTSPNDQPRYNYIIELTDGRLIQINTNDQHPILDSLSAFFINIHKKASLTKATEKHSFEISTIDNYRVTLN